VDERVAFLLQQYEDGKALLAAARATEAESAADFLEDKRYLLAVVSVTENWPFGDVALLALLMRAGASLRALRRMRADHAGANEVIDRLVPIVSPDLRLERGRFTEATVPMTATAWLALVLIALGIILPFVAFEAPRTGLAIGVSVAGILLLVFNRLG
jgi:hypothetical protein